MRPATWCVVPGDAHKHEETWDLHDVTEQELIDIIDVLQHHPSFRFLRSSSSNDKTSSSSSSSSSSFSSSSTPHRCCHYQWLKISNVLQFLSIVTLSITSSSLPSGECDGVPSPPAAPATTVRRSTRRSLSNQSHQKQGANQDSTNSSSSSSSSSSRKNSNSSTSLSARSIPNPQSNSQSNDSRPRSLTLVARSVSASIVPAFVPLPVGAVLAVLFFWVPFPDWYGTHTLLIYHTHSSFVTTTYPPF